MYVLKEAYFSRLCEIAKRREAINFNEISVAYFELNLPSKKKTENQTPIS